MESPRGAGPSPSPFAVDDDPKAPESFPIPVPETRVRPMAAAQRPRAAQAIRFPLKVNGTYEKRTLAAYNTPKVDEESAC